MVMKFPKRVMVNLRHGEVQGTLMGDPNKECEISIAAVNAIVKFLAAKDGRIVTQISVRIIENGRNQRYKAYADFDRITDMDGNPYGHRIKKKRQGDNACQSQEKIKNSHDEIGLLA